MRIENSIDINYTTTMIILVFIIGIILCVFCTVAIFYLKLADDWTLKTIANIEKQSIHVICQIKELKEELKKFNKIMNFIKDFKKSKFRKIFIQAVNIINLIMLLQPKLGAKTKLKRFFGLSVIKRVFCALKPLFEA